jgi:hypothetical protein
VDCALDREAHFLLASRRLSFTPPRCSEFFRPSFRLRWPVQRRLNLDARIACIDALAGAGTCHDVRAKFVEAAREAGVPLGDG